MERPGVSPTGRASLQSLLTLAASLPSGRQNSLRIEKRLPSADRPAIASVTRSGSSSRTSLKYIELVPENHRTETSTHELAGRKPVLGEEHHPHVSGLVEEGGVPHVRTLIVRCPPNRSYHTPVLLECTRQLPDSSTSSRLRRLARSGPSGVEGPRPHDLLDEGHRHRLIEREADASPSTFRIPSMSSANGRRIAAVTG